MDTEFPTNPDDFDKDERISFSKLEDRFIAVHDDGSEFEFDPKLKHWVPIDDDWEREFGRQPPLSPVPEAGERKRKHRDSAEGAEDNLDPSAPAQRPRKKAKAPPKPKQNTAVYVTGLPTDATVDEIHDLFSRKGGLIAEEIDSRAPRIKLYRDEAGDFKGDALVVFFKPDSVRMAIMLLDDTDFRYDAQGKGQGRMRVQEADSSYKKVQIGRR
ncbi:hypothetical protein CDD83_10622 [Cordyceps sp. RAO-2017]|nr:hypothetical protein CDD83_10622 [Cordyceps sp. RAO-2017]